MKPRYYLVALALFISACSLSGGPASVAKSWMSYVEEGKYEDAFNLYSTGYVKKLGADKVRSALKDLHDTIAAEKQRTGSFSIEKREETIKGDTARVDLLLKGGGKNNQVEMVFVMIKENGKWRIKEFE